MPAENIPTYIIRRVRKSDAPKLYPFLKEEHWPVSKEIVDDVVEKSAQATFLLAEAEDGTIISLCCSVPADGDNVAIPWFLTDPRYRGSGIGTILWKQVMQSSPSGTQMSLHSVPNMVSYYGRSGFTVQGPKCTYYAQVPKASLKPQNLPEGVHIVDGAVVPEHKLRAYDFAICPVDRFKQIKNHTQMCFKVRVALNANGNVVGITGAIELDTNYYQISPLYAEDDIIARELVRQLLTSLPGGSRIGIHVVTDKDEAMTLCNELGLVIDDPCYTIPTQLLTTNEINFSLNKVYAIAGHFIPLV